MSTNFIEEIIERDLATGRVASIQTRFPPEPNGYLHIGHAKAIWVSYGAALKYGGKFFLRFDDTNPEAENIEYVNGIQADIAWLGAKWDKLIFSSDYFDIMFDVALRLIKAGKAFVCDLSAEQISKTRGSLTEAGQNSPWRDRSAEENLSLFLAMRDGKFADGEKVLRAKIDMASPNINMRDPVIYRILRATHHNTGDKWCIYPMYDYAHPLEDAIEGTTHSLCSLEFEDHRPLYDWVVINSGLENRPQQIEFARLNITDTLMSKRFLKRLVDEKFVRGWDDPRMPTLCGCRRRGIPPEAIRDFCERIGVAKSNSVVEMSYFESLVREYLNKTAPRAMAVLHPLKVVLTNATTAETLDVECSAPGIEPPQTRKTAFGREIYIDKADFAAVPPPKYHRLTPDGYVRLKGAYIIRCLRFDADANGEPTCLYCEVVPSSKSGNDTSGIKVKGVVQWVDAATAKPAKVRLFESLLAKDAPEDAEFAQKVNKNSLTELDALVEAGICGEASGSRFQFMREGYFCIDPDSVPAAPVFNQIVALKDNFNK